MIPTGETEVLGENLVHHIFHWDWRRIESGPAWWKAGH